ncbi:AI-2E family transporter [Polyangium aurulentum]|uniref:AI-2E family transporter n=1 Tax=Polyangium aurulentum TaxID=2567896 RepID=UPI001F27219C|nr:AI-2E family transporter [Polyangium aurulentum]
MSELPRPAEKKWERRIFLALSAAIVITIIVVAHAVMLPFVLALVVAYVLTPAVVRVERRGVPRWAAILLVYTLTLGAVGGFVAVIVPRLVSEGRGLASEWPNLTRKVREDWLPSIDARLGRWSGQPAGEPSPTPELRSGDAQPLVGVDPLKADEKPPMRIVKRDDGSFDVFLSEDLRLHEVRNGTWEIESEPPPKGLSSAKVLREGFDKAIIYLRQNALEILKFGQIIAGAISRAIFNLFMTLMLAGYIILTHEKILGFFRDLWPPEARSAFDRFLRRLDRGLSGVVRGQLLICLVNGVLSAIGFWLFHLKYWPILSILAGVMSLIPIFGSILSSIPAVAIGLTQSPTIAFGVLAWIVGIHQLEANFLNPKIIGDAAKIHPVLVVFSLLVGEHFFQITGALFAVPCMSIAQTIFLHFRESTLGLRDPMSTTIPPPAPPPKTPIEPAGSAGIGGSGA